MFFPFDEQQKKGQVTTIDSKKTNSHVCFFKKKSGIIYDQKGSFLNWKTESGRH
jgi:hypothetical protein